MKITSFQRHRRSGVFHGYATSTRGRQYEYFIRETGEDAGAFREMKGSPLGELHYWHCVSTPRALLAAVRTRIAQAA